MKSEKSKDLYELMLRKGYTEEFSDLITQNLNTDFTAKRMIGFLAQFQQASLEVIVDEMLAILNDRNRLMNKKILENTNIAMNQLLNHGLDD